MVGIEDLRPQGAHGLRSLVHGHGVGLVHGQKGDVDVAQRLHFGSVLAVAGNVDARAAEREHVAHVLAFARMEVEVPLGGVVGCHGLDAHVVARCGRVAGPHDEAFALESLGRGLVADEEARALRHGVDRGPVEVVVVGVGDEHQVGFRKTCVVRIAAHGVGIDVFSLVFDRECRVAEESEREFRAVARRERVLRMEGRVVARGA